MTHSTSTVSTYASQREWERSPDQRALSFLKCSILLTNILTPCALETWPLMVSLLPQYSHDCSPIFNSTRRQTLAGSLVQWLIHLWSTRKILRPHWFGLFLILFDSHTWTQWTLNASSASARDQSRPGSLSPKLKHKLCVDKIACIKQRGRLGSPHWWKILVPFQGT